MLTETRDFENVPTGTQSAGKRSQIKYLNNNQLNISDSEFMGVNQLVAHNPFVLKARVTSKGDLRTFKKDGGDSHVFSADMIDKEGNEITVTFFGEAAQTYQSDLEVNVVYVLRNGTTKNGKDAGSVRMVNSKFSKKNINDYQIVYDRVGDNAITKVDDDADIMHNKFNFVKIKDLQASDMNAIVDVAGYIKDVFNVQAVAIKKGTETRDRRNFTIFDDSNAIVEMTLWGEPAKETKLQKGQLVLIKGARVSEYANSKALSSTFGTIIITDPSQMPTEADLQKMSEWKTNNFNEEQLTSISAEPVSRKYLPWTIDEVNNFINSGSITTTGFFDVTAHVTHIKTEATNLFYPSCTKCPKKAEQISDNNWKCGDCNINFAQPAYRYTLSVKLSDQTGSIWVNAFDKVATVIVGNTEAQQMKLLKETNEVAMTEKFKEALHKEYNFKIMAKNERYQDQQGNYQQRTKVQATRVEKLVFTTQCKGIFGLLEEYSTKQNSQY